MFLDRYGILHRMILNFIAHAIAIGLFVACLLVIGEVRDGTLLAVNATAWLIILTLAQRIRFT